MGSCGGGGGCQCTRSPFPTQRAPHEQQPQPPQQQHQLGLAHLDRLVPGAVEEDVLGLEVAVADPPAVAEGHGVHHAAGQHAAVGLGDAVALLVEEVEEVLAALRWCLRVFGMRTRMRVTATTGFGRDGRQGEGAKLAGSWTHLVHHDVEAVAPVDHVVHLEDAPVPQRPLGAHLAVHALQLRGGRGGGAGHTDEDAGRRTCALSQWHHSLTHSVTHSPRRGSRPCPC